MRARWAVAAVLMFVVTISAAVARANPDARCGPGHGHRHHRRCVTSRPQPTPSRPTRTPTTTDQQATFDCGVYINGCYDLVSAGVYAGSEQLVGRPITFTITDATTSTTAGSFPGTSNAYATCSLVRTDSGSTMSWTGQAVGPYQACELTSAISVPAADVPLISASFAGDSRYAPSTGTPTNV